MSSVALHQAQNLGALLPPLLLEAERVAQTVYQGVHGRRRAGTGESFWQFRHYEPGDAAERIDWRTSARTDKVFVREREWEAAQTAYLWADTSGSMQYHSDKNLPTKASRAQLLMLALASLLLRGGEKVIWLGGHRHTSVHGKSGLERIASRLGDNNLPGDSLPPPAPMSRYSHAVLCGDFLMPEEALQKLMHDYVARNVRGALVHIIDPVEDNFPFDGRVELQGLESEDPLLIPNASALHDAYNERMATHKARLRAYAEGAGWRYIPHITSAAPHLALMNIYQALAAERN